LPFLGAGFVVVYFSFSSSASILSAPGILLILIYFQSTLISVAYLIYLSYTNYWTEQVDEAPPSQTSTQELKLDFFLQNSLGVKYLKKFLNMEFSVENLLFLNEIRSFKSNPNDPNALSRAKRKSSAHAEDFDTEKPTLSEAKLKMAKNIYSTYIKVGAASEINIGGDIRRAIETKVSENIYSIDMYDDADRSVYYEVTTDSFKRFKKSDIYRQFLEEQKKFAGRV